MPLDSFVSVWSSIKHRYTDKPLIAMAKSVNTHRIFLLLVGIAVAVILAWQTQRVDNVNGNRPAIQNMNMNKTSLLIVPAAVLSQSKEIVKIILFLEKK